MKYIKSIVFSAIVALSLSSCTDWLDVNVDPNNPTAESSKVENRLAWCQFYLNNAYQFGGSRTVFACGPLTSTSRTTRDGAASQWEPQDGLTNTPYQWFFVGCGSNLEDMYQKGISQGAFQYAGASRLLRAYGFMMMTDLYGEMPYTEALGANATPRYDNGKTIFLGCIADLEEAIQLLAKPHAKNAPSLAMGDSWNGGDANKWIKMAYLLKARFLANLNKKAAGSYKEGKYDTAEILRCLDMAMASNNDNTVVNHTDANGPTHDVLGWDEPVDYSPLFSVVGGSTANRVTKSFVDNLTNFAGNGIEDPRADKLIPWAKSKKSANSPTEIKWEGNWRRSVGVDMSTNIRTLGAPYTLSWDNATSEWVCKTKDDSRLGDTIYVITNSGAKGFSNTKDLLYRMNEKNDGSAVSSMFYVRPSAPSYVACYHEVCFIRAEILFNQGQRQPAFEAYRKGIQANIELMNQKLEAWCGEDGTLKSCPSFTPMTQADIDNFLNKGIGTSGDLTLGKIMTQKSLAMMFSIQQWNDMRRYDYNPQIFLSWNIPFEYSTNVKSLEAIPQGKQWRRWRQCSIETNYNINNLNAIAKEVPGALVTSKSWNKEKDVWAINVWWDSDQQ